MNNKPPKSYSRIVVIGGGIVGLTSALALQRKDNHLTVIDPGNADNRASSATAGIIGGSAVIPWASPTLFRNTASMLYKSESPLNLAFPYPHDLVSFMFKSRKAGQPDPYFASASGLAALGLNGRAFWADLLKANDAALDLFKQTGCYLVYLSNTDRHKETENNELRRRMGMELVELDDRELGSRIPELTRKQAGGVNVVRAGHVIDPHQLQQLLRTEIEKRGGTFVRGHASDFHSTGNQVSAVSTANDTLNLDCVIVAAGAGSAPLARILNCPVPILPARGYSLLLHNTNIRLGAPLLVLSQGVAITPAVDGLRVAGLLTIGGGDKSNHHTFYQRLLKRINQLFDGLEYEHISHCSGVRPLTPDSLPVIGPTQKYKNAYFNFGHGHWGLTQAATSAAILADLVSDRTPEIDASQFRVSRF